MEADSTTYDGQIKPDVKETFPFPTSPCNMKLYMDLTHNNSEKSLESQIVEKLQMFGLLPRNISCPTGKPDCQLVCKTARVIDRVQWLCEGCGKRQPIRTGSFFLRLQCSLLQALQMILAWAEDAECTVAAEHLGIKPKVANMIYDKLDDLAVKEHRETRLGGENAVVIAEMYPDCLNRLSPDTTDQPHVHRILMLADTNHIPTSYKLHVIQDDLKKQMVTSFESQSLRTEVEEVISKSIKPNSTVVVSGNVPPVEGAVSLHQLQQHCDAEMQHFLNSRVWRQALTICGAARDLCAGAPTAGCAAAVQRYLNTSLYRLPHNTDLYQVALDALASRYTVTP